LQCIFRESGYETYGIGKVFHPSVSSNYTDDAAYSWSLEPFHPSTRMYKNSAVCPDADGSLHKNLLCAVDVLKQPEQTLPDIQSKEEAVRYQKVGKCNANSKI
jgi:iduronate 2-sulfatase